MERTHELLNGGATDGRCHVALMVETLLEARRSNVKSKPGKLSDDSPSTHVSSMVNFARFGLSPKVMWWLNGNIVEMIMGLRLQRGLVAAENERIASLLLRLDGASVGGHSCCSRWPTKQQL